MEIKVTNFVLTDHFCGPNNEPSLNFIYPALQEFKKVKAPVSVAYNIIKSIGAVEKALADYENTRKAICEQLCDKDKKDNPIIESGKYKFSDENYREFQKKWHELLNTEVLIDIWSFPKKDTEDIKEINIYCYETLMKYGFIKEEVKTEMKPSNGNTDKK